MVEFLEKATAETNINDYSSTMNVCRKNDSHQKNSIIFIFTIDSTPTNQNCLFYEGLGHIVGICLYKPN
jgi:hypothetical protein